MADTYLRRAVVHDSDPAIGAIAIDYASGDQEITVAARGVYIATAGALKVDMANGSTVTFSSMAAGTIYPIAITKIYQTGSTAAGLVLV